MLGRRGRIDPHNAIRSGAELAEPLGDSAALLDLAEGHARGGAFDLGSELALRAYLLPGAPRPEPAELERLFVLFTAGEHGEAFEVRPRSLPGARGVLEPAPERVRVGAGASGGKRERERETGSRRRVPGSAGDRSRPMLAQCEVRGWIANPNHQ